MGLYIEAQWFYKSVWSRQRVTHLPVTMVKQTLLTPYRRNDPIGHITNS